MNRLKQMFALAALIFAGTLAFAVPATAAPSHPAQIIEGGLGSSTGGEEGMLGSKTFLMAAPQTTVRTGIYKNCTDAWQHGAHDILKGTAEYEEYLDGHKTERTPNEPDGIACELKNAPPGVFKPKPKPSPSSSSSAPASPPPGTQPPVKPTVSKTAVVAQPNRQDILPVTGPGTGVYLGAGLGVVLIAVGWFAIRRSRRNRHEFVA